MTKQALPEPAQLALPAAVLPPGARALVEALQQAAPPVVLLQAPRASAQVALRQPALVV